MENINILINKKTRQVNLSKSVIGNDGENLQENFIFSFDEFVNGTARLELIKNNGVKSYIMLTKVDNTYQLPIKSVITKGGRITMQLVITEGTDDEEIPIFKSNEFYVVVNSSINAEIEEPDEYAEWIDVANTKLNELDNIDIDVEKVGDTATITITKKDGTEQSVEIYDGTDGTNGQDGVSPVVSTSKSGKITTIEITDKNGTHTATINDGENGQDGIGLNYNWQGTSLGIKRENEQNYDYVNLKGSKGDTGNSGVEISTTQPTDPNINVWINTSDGETSNNYSKTETVIGTWIDGSTLYRKVVEYTNESTIGNSTSTTQILIPHEITNLNMVVNARVINNMNIQLPVFNKSSSNQNYMGRGTCINEVTSENINLRIINDTWSSRTWYFILEYTKTNSNN